MKLTAFIVLSVCLQVSARTGLGQQTITLSERNAALETVLQEIHDQTGYEYFFKAEDAKTVKVTIDVKNTPVNEVLPLFFQGGGFTYEIVNKIIVVKKREEIKGAASQNDGGRRPPFEVEGNVTDETGEPLSGATVKLKNGKIVALTDEKGRFKLKNIDEDATVEISYTGYTSKQFQIGNQSSFKVSLTRSTNKLDEVQVIAYGTSTERLNTGNVTKVTSKEIEQQPVSNPLAALEGRVPGLVITQTTGVPGGAYTVQIRGQNSIANGNDPFYVIDGVPYYSQFSGQAGLGGLVNATFHGGSPLNFINPYDIESIEVLKDADATSIYGSRAANGAILITTKKGKAGRMTVDLNIKSGATSPARDIALLNTKQYLAMRHEAFMNDGVTPGISDYDVNGDWDTTRYTNWSKVFTNNHAQYTDAEATVSGGNSNMQYLAGAGYTRQTTGFPRLIPGDGADQKASVHVNINSTSLNKKFKFSLTASYVSDKNTVQSVDYSETRLQLAPDAPSIYNQDGTLNWAPLAPGQAGTWANPYSYLVIKYKGITSNLVGNATLGYMLLPGLELKTSLGYNNTDIQEIQVYPTTFYDPAYNATSGATNFNTVGNNSWIIEPQLNYKLHLGKGIFSTLLGGSFHENNSQNKNLSATGFISDALLENIQAASIISVTNSTSAQYKYNAIFGRLNYNLQDKYLLNLTARRDGSSRFGPGKQFGDFASVGAAWIFSKEDFISQKFSFFSFGKLRASYGTTGNDQIGDYQFLNLYQTNSYPYQGMQGLYPANLFNTDLAWEIDRKLELGMELGFFKDRITIQGSWYRNRSGNQLVTSPLSAVTGYVTIPANLPAVVQNSGQELIVNTVNIKTKDFNWSSSFNISIVRNKLISFKNLASSSYADYLTVGKPLGMLKVYNFIGVNDTTGLYQFADSKGAPTYTPDRSTNVDRTALINTAPRFYGGLRNTFEYKGFSLDVFFQFVKQTGKNLFGGYTILPGRAYNIPTFFLDHWQKPGDKATFQKFSQSYSGQAYRTLNIAQQSSFAYSDASFIRLKNIALSWQLPNDWKQKLHLENARIYIQGQNLTTITKYRGIDPETQGTGLPPMRAWTAGFQVSF